MDLEELYVLDSTYLMRRRMAAGRKILLHELNLLEEEDDGRVKPFAYEIWKVNRQSFSPSKRLSVALSRISTKGKEIKLDIWIRRVSSLDKSITTHRTKSISISDVIYQLTNSGVDGFLQTFDINSPCIVLIRYAVICFPLAGK
ncbi:hypothetical protein J6590_051120 [Homalodisca vitripennis]|nr:hypothetical protein J6590_051120 [Homalodisca vitripennis]